VYEYVIQGDKYTECRKCSGKFWVSGDKVTCTWVFVCLCVWLKNWLVSIYIYEAGYTGCLKKIVPFFIYFFPRCLVCGEWCKLHWLLLDSPSFDWNTRRSLYVYIIYVHYILAIQFLKKVQSFSDTLYVPRVAGDDRSIGVSLKFNRLQCRIDITVYWAMWQHNSRRIDIECARNAPKNCDAYFLMPLLLKFNCNLAVRHGGSVDGCENSYCCDIVCSGMREANILGDGCIFFLLGIVTYKPDCTVPYLERLQCEGRDPLETDGGWLGASLIFPSCLLLLVSKFQW
jgi:hypothetical protein